MASSFTFGTSTSRRVDRLYQTADVVAQRRAVLEALALQPGEAVLDVGSGPGLLAIEMAEQVAVGGRVVGVDISESMHALSRERAAARPDLVGISFEIGDAIRLPVPNDSFDAIVSTQVLEYVSDVPAALLEMKRVLRPDGRLLLLDTDWDSAVWRSSDPARMDRIIRAWEGHGAHPRLPGMLAPLLREAGFAVERQAVVPLFNPSFDEETYSAGVIGMIEQFVAARGGIDPAEARAWSADLRELGARGEYFFSLNRYLFVARKPPE